jgi:hypothetical protein
MVTFQTHFTANIAGVPVDVRAEDLPAESLAFVFEYGLRQYIQDGAAVSKTFASGDRKGQLKSDEEIAAEKQDGVTERLENLRTGEFTRRSAAGPKMTPEEKHRDQIVMDRLEAAVKAVGKKLPTKTGKNADPEALARIKAAYYAKHQDAIDKEVKRRLKDSEKVEDLSDILG